MIYRDYSRKAGEWIPNEYGGRENLEAIEFLRNTNRILGEQTPGAVTMAEESTDFTGVTRPPAGGGLGFWFKWNLGWMHDTTGLHEARSGASPLPSRQNDLRHALQLHREFCAAALPR